MSHRTSYVPHRTSYVPHRTSYVSHRTSYVPHRTSYVSHRTSYVSHRTSYVSSSCNISSVLVLLNTQRFYVPHRTSYVSHRTSYVSHRTSYVPHRTSSVLVLLYTQRFSYSSIALTCVCADDTYRQAHTCRTSSGTRYAVYLLYWYESTNTDAKRRCQAAGSLAALLKKRGILIFFLPFFLTCYLLYRYRSTCLQVQGV